MKVGKTASLEEAKAAKESPGNCLCRLNSSPLEHSLVYALHMYPMDVLFLMFFPHFLARMLFLQIKNKMPYSAVKGT